MRFDFTVHVECETSEQAAQVMSERVDPYEDYGFPYRLTWSYQGDANDGVVDGVVNYFDQRYTDADEG